MMTIELLDEAMEDIVDGGFFYRQQGGDALKDYFVDSIFASIDRLSFSANAYPVRHGCHRLLVDRFPYSVYYRIKGNVVKVWRVLDNRRDPVTLLKSNKDELEPVDYIAGLIGLAVVAIVGLLLLCWIHSTASSAGTRSTLPWQPSHSAS